MLDGYANFLQERELALSKHQQYLVRWVREFLHFAREHGGYTFEQTLDFFPAGDGGRAGVEPWQVQQAAGTVFRFAVFFLPPDYFSNSTNCSS